MTRALRLAWGLAIGCQLWCAGPVFGLPIDVFLNPTTQTANVGAGVSVQIKLNANGASICQGGVFLQFDTSRLSFVNGSNNTATWNFSFFNVQPAQSQPGIISLNVG